MHTSLIIFEVFFSGTICNLNLVYRFIGLLKALSTQTVVRHMLCVCDFEYFLAALTAGGARLETDVVYSASVISFARGLLRSLHAYWCSGIDVLQLLLLPGLGTDPNAHQRRKWDSTTSWPWIICRCSMRKWMQSATLLQRSPSNQKGKKNKIVMRNSRGNSSKTQEKKIKLELVHRRFPGCYLKSNRYWSIQLRCWLVVSSINIHHLQNYLPRQVPCAESIVNSLELRR